MTMMITNAIDPVMMPANSPCVSPEDVLVSGVPDDAVIVPVGVALGGGA